MITQIIENLRIKPKFKRLVTILDVIRGCFNFAFSFIDTALSCYNTRDMKLAVFIPAHNEENTVADVIKRIPTRINGISKIAVYVIDDGSTDSTADAAKKAGAEVVGVSPKRGLATAFKIGLQTAVAAGADIICHLDADGQYNPQEIDQVISPILKGEADFVTGNREVEKINWMDPARKYGNRIGSWFLRVLAGLPVQDASCGFRAYSRLAADRLDVSSEHTYTHETLIEAKFKGVRIAEAPVSFTFRPRQEQSRLTKNLFGHIFKSLRGILGAYVRYRKG